jgi:hypothetical protein
MTSQPTTSRLSSASFLWASAFILLGLVVVQAGRLAGIWMNTASADVVSRVADFTTLTMTATASEDLALVLDGRAEKLYVYRIKNRESVELVRPYELPSLFQNGTRVGAGKTK